MFVNETHPMRGQARRNVPLCEINSVTRFAENSVHRDRHTRLDLDSEGKETGPAIVVRDIRRLPREYKYA